MFGHLIINKMRLPNGYELEGDSFFFWCSERKKRNDSLGLHLQPKRKDEQVQIQDRTRTALEGKEEKVLQVLSIQRDWPL